MITITTPSRLHFGLLSLAEPGACWTGRAGSAAVPARRFGGAGVMIDQPGVRLRAEPAAAWSVDGPLARRVLAVVERFAAACATPLPPSRIVVERCPAEHVGLGVGTQLALAVARALAERAGLELPIEELARRAGRGERSGIGVHGFARGGFLVDGGQARPGAIAPLLARTDFPDDWRIVLVRPAQAPGVHGEPERAAFARLLDHPARTATLCRLLLLGLLPALAERDLQTFGQALHEFNACAGEPFAPAQGGIYASPAIEELIRFLRAEGCAGVGQSSWGPTVFAVVADEQRAAHLVRRLHARGSLGAADVTVARGDNHGARVLRESQ